MARENVKDKITELGKTLTCRICEQDVEALRLLDHSRLCVEIKGLEQKLDEVNHWLISKSKKFSTLKKNLSYEYVQMLMTNTNKKKLFETKKDSIIFNGGATPSKEDQSINDNTIDHQRNLFKARKCNTAYNFSSGNSASYHQRTDSPNRIIEEKNVDGETKKKTSFYNQALKLREEKMDSAAHTSGEFEPLHALPSVHSISQEDEPILTHDNKNLCDPVLDFDDLMDANMTHAKEKDIDTPRISFKSPPRRPHIDNLAELDIHHKIQKLPTEERGKANDLRRLYKNISKQKEFATQYGKPSKNRPNKNGGLSSRKGSEFTKYLSIIKATKEIFEKIQR